MLGAKQEVVDAAKQQLVGLHVQLVVCVLCWGKAPLGAITLKWPLRGVCAVNGTRPCLIAWQWLY